MSKIIIGISSAALIFVMLWFARPAGRGNQSINLPSSSVGIIAIEESNFDFGVISMAAGKVKHDFKLKNQGAEPVIIGKIYTSCMCTVATLIKDGKEFGPYGMPGHGFIPRIEKQINPGEEAVVEIVFDPAAHGPAGIGKIQRVITLENNLGSPIEFMFTANVTP